MKCNVYNIPEMVSYNEPVMSTVFSDRMRSLTPPSYKPKILLPQYDNLIRQSSPPISPPQPETR